MTAKARRRRNVAAGCFVARVVAGGHAGGTEAQAPRSVRIGYEVAPGCPDETSFEAQIRARTSKIVVATDGATSVHVRISPRGGRFEGEVTLVDANGHESRRRVEGPCEDVAAALALITALALDPAASTASDPLRRPNSPDRGVHPRAIADERAPGATSTVGSCFARLRLRASRRRAGADARLGLVDWHRRGAHPRSRTRPARLRPRVLRSVAALERSVRPGDSRPIRARRQRHGLGRRGGGGLHLDGREPRPLFSSPGHRGVSSSRRACARRGVCSRRRAPRSPPFGPTHAPGSRSASSRAHVSSSSGRSSPRSRGGPSPLSSVTDSSSSPTRPSSKPLQSPLPERPASVLPFGDQRVSERTFPLRV